MKGSTVYVFDATGYRGIWHKIETNIEGNQTPADRAREAIARAARSLSETVGDGTGEDVTWMPYDESAGVFLDEDGTASEYTYLIAPTGDEENGPSTIRPNRILDAKDAGGEYPWLITGYRDGSRRVWVEFRGTEVAAREIAERCAQAIHPSASYAWSMNSMHTEGKYGNQQTGVYYKMASAFVSNV